MKPAHIRDYDLLVVGESFVEFRCDGDVAATDTYDKDIGGADLVVAVAAARLGSGVSLISAMAGDPFHSMIRERLISHGINIDHVITCQGYNGIYFTSPIRSKRANTSFTVPAAQRTYHAGAHIR